MLSTQHRGWTYSAGQRVLDACAAPGGKAAHILELADVALTALELDTARAARVNTNLARLGLSAELRVADCRSLDDWWNGRPFERILADVPCSASGVARRHPDIKWLRRESDVARFAAQSRDILDVLWRVLAPGGKMLFVTCSSLPGRTSSRLPPSAIVMPIVCAFHSRAGRCPKPTR